MERCISKPYLARYLIAVRGNVLGRPEMEAEWSLTPRWTPLLHVLKPPQCHRSNFSTELTGVIIKVYLNSLYAYQSTLASTLGHPGMGRLPSCNGNGNPASAFALGGQAFVAGWYPAVGAFTSVASAASFGANFRSISFATTPAPSAATV
jgi:hypothetical protein